jgi:hypothetical protein
MVVSGQSRAPATYVFHRIGGWMGSRANMDGFGKEKLSYSCRFPDFQLVAISKPSPGSLLALRYGLKNSNLSKLLKLVTDTVVNCQSNYRPKLRVIFARYFSVTLFRSFN